MQFTTSALKSADVDKNTNALTALLSPTIEFAADRYRFEAMT
jgi:hypothetical protein